MQKKMTDKELNQAGLDAVSLLQKGEFKRIRKEFGYALSYGRPIAKAIEEDLNKALDECEFSGEIETSKTRIEVSHFKSNSTQLKSLVECYFELSEEKGILLELVLLESGQIYLEDISSYQIPSKE